MQIDLLDILDTVIVYPFDETHDGWRRGFCAYMMMSQKFSLVVLLIIILVCRK